MFGFRRKRKVHLLHIGKTGGSAIKSVLKKHLKTDKYNLRLHEHETTLQDIPVGDYVVFFLRDPVARFISGFYSRQRKGQPRYYSEWSPLEKEVFEAFNTPNELAIALSQENPLAIRAMEGVDHFKHYSYWYKDFEYFQSRFNDILYIGFQESLDTDFAKLKESLGLPLSLSLPDDDVGAHRNPKNLDKSIDDDGMNALVKWYEEDLKFISLCKEIMADK